MGILGFLQFAVKFVDLFVWPIFALAYPLFASIRAIETNSNYDMKKLVTYWILFSSISLFELTFVKVIEWFPLWAYIKIIAICWLVIPRFGHAYHAYKSLVQMCSNLNLQVFINWLNNQDKEPFLKTEEAFLSVVEKFIKENGSQALEELIANKSRAAKPSLDVKEKMAVTVTEKNEMPTTIEGAKPNVEAEEVKIVANTEKKEMAAVESRGAKPSLDVKEKMAVIVTEKNEMPTIIEGAKPNVEAEEVKIVANTEKKEMAAVESRNAKPSLDVKEKMAVTVTEKNEMPTTIEGAKPNVEAEKVKIVANTKKKEMAAIEVKLPAEAVEIKEMNMSQPQASGENAPSLNKVQKEWTCVVCQVTTTSKKTLNDHLGGKKHLSKCEELKAKKQVLKNKTSSSAQANQNANECVFGVGVNPGESTKQQEKKVQLNDGNSIKPEKADMKKERWCSICNVSCLGESGMASHLKGRKHLKHLNLPS